MKHAPFKDWQHFVITAPGLDVLVNFSLADGTGRVVVLARTASWSGFVDSSRDVEVATDGSRIRIGSSRCDIDTSCYRIAIDAPAHGVALQATFRPVVLPVIARRSRIAPAGRLDGSVTARMTVTARVVVRDETFELDGVAGYHDHGCGQFRWGDDFAWEWGTVQPRDGGDWAIAYSNLTNRARTQSTAEHLFAWQGGRAVLAATGGELRTRMYGRARTGPELRLPPVMALLQPSRCTDVPQRHEVLARTEVDELCVRFSPASIAHVLVPSERSLRGAITITECVGPVRVEGRLGSETVEWDGWGIYEFVR